MGENETLAVDPFSNRLCDLYHNITWEDITTEFLHACSGLHLGELIHDEVFGLFEAMSAIEMMDPKMDVGIISGEDGRIPHTFHSAVMAGILKLDDFTCSELIGIFDSIFSCMVCWLEGHSLDQILYTCLYLHNPTGIFCEVLRNFCLGIRKLIPLIKDLIIEGNVSEEEDFQLFGISSLSMVDCCTEQQAINLLKQCEDELIKKSSLDEKHEDNIAVMYRVRLLRHILQVIYELFPKKNKLYDDLTIVEIKKQLNAALELIPYITTTINKGTPPDPNCELPNPIGYSPRVNQRNLPPTFPRSTRIRDRLSSFQFVEDLLKKLKMALKITHQRNYHSTLNFFIEFSKKSHQCLLSRSVLQIIFFRSQSIKQGVDHFEKFLRDSIRRFVAPPVLMSRNQHVDSSETRKYVSSFFNYCVNLHTFTYFIQICGHNRARQRDKLARLIEEGFGTLQEEAARLDSHLSLLFHQSEAPNQHGSHFGTWTLYYSLRAMALFLLSGFELELYSVHEYIYIYWYLYEILFGFIVTTLTRAETLSIAQDETESHQKGIPKQRKMKIKKKKAKLHFREVVSNHALQMMSGGYYKAIIAFEKDGRIKKPKAKFDFQEIRFKHRFSPFRNLINPTPVSYLDFVNARSNHSRLSTVELYLAAANHFRQARAIMESIMNPDQEMIQIIQVAKINFVVTNLLANGHKRDSVLQPDFDFSLNAYFPVLKIN